MVVIRRYCNLPKLLAFSIVAANYIDVCIASITAFQSSSLELTTTTTNRKKSSKFIRHSSTYGIISQQHYNSAQDVNRQTLFATNIESDNEQTEITSKVSKRRRVLNLLGLRKLSSSKVKQSEDTTTAKEPPFDVSTIQELTDYFNDTEKRFRKKNDDIDYLSLLASLSVKGDTQIIGSPEHKGDTSSGTTCS